MANLNLGQDVAKKKRKTIDSCLYSGQILSPTSSCNIESLRFSYQSLLLLCTSTTTEVELLCTSQLLQQAKALDFYVEWRKQKRRKALHGGPGNYKSWIPYISHKFYIFRREFASGLQKYKKYNPKYRFIEYTNFT